MVSIKRYIISYTSKSYDCSSIYCSVGGVWSTYFNFSHAQRRLDNNVKTNSMLISKYVCQYEA